MDNREYVYSRRNGILNYTKLIQQYLYPSITDDQNDTKYSTELCTNTATIIFQKRYIIYKHKLNL